MLSLNCYSTTHITRSLRYPRCPSLHGPSPRLASTCPSQAPAATAPPCHRPPSLFPVVARPPSSHPIFHPSDALALVDIHIRFFPSSFLDAASVLLLLCSPPDSRFQTRARHTSPSLGSHSRPLPSRLRPPTVRSCLDLLPIHPDIQKLTPNPHPQQPRPQPQKWRGSSSRFAARPTPGSWWPHAQQPPCTATILEPALCATAAAPWQTLLRPLPTTALPPTRRCPLGNERAMPLSTTNQSARAPAA